MGEDKIYVRAVLVVLVLDGFTEKPIAGDAAYVRLEGEEPPVMKKDGYRVFVNVRQKTVRLICGGGMYEKKTETVDLSDRTAEEIHVVRLQPGRGYVMPEKTTCIRGYTDAGRRLRFWNRGGYRLLYDYTQKERDLLRLYNPQQKNLEGKSFWIQDGSGQKEYFTVIGSKGEACRMDRELENDYKKVGSLVIPVYETCADERGEFFLPLFDISEKEQKIFCLMDGETEEKELTVTAGRINTIVL